MFFKKEEKKEEKIKPIECPKTEPNEDTVGGVLLLYCKEIEQLEKDKKALEKDLAKELAKKMGYPETKYSNNWYSEVASIKIKAEEKRVEVSFNNKLDFKFCKETMDLLLDFFKMNSIDFEQDTSSYSDYRITLILE